MKTLNKTTIVDILKGGIIALPYAILISFIFTIGGVIQEIVIKLFSSEESNLYDTVHQGMITVFDVGFIKWFISYYHTWLIIPCLLIVMLINNTTPKKAFIRTAFLVFIILTILDYFLFDSNYEDFDILTNVTFNLIGSLIIAAILVLSIDTGMVINNYFENYNMTLRRIISSLIAIIYGFIIVFIIYTIYKNIYTVTPSNINLTLNLPVNGVYNTDNNSTSENFGLFSSPTPNVEKFSWIGFNHHFTLKWNAKTNKKANTYDAEIRVIGECLPDKNLISKALLNIPTYTLNDISNLELFANDGPIKLFTLNNSKIGKLLVTTDHSTIFNIKDLKKLGYQLSRWIKESDRITHLSWTNQVSYVLFLPNIDYSDSKVYIKNRDIAIKSNTETLKINLIPNKITSDINLSCSTFPASDNGRYKLKSVLGGVILTLKKTNKNSSVLDDFNTKNKTFIQGFSGWMIAKEINKTKITSFINQGNLNMLNTRAHIEQLILDKNKYYKESSQVNDIYITKANLHGEIIDNKLLKINGSSKVIYINQQRATSTRWEKINLKYKFLFFSLFSSLLYLIIKRLRVILNNKTEIKL